MKNQLNVVSPDTMKNIPSPEVGTRAFSSGADNNSANKYTKTHKNELETIKDSQNSISETNEEFDDESSKIEKTLKESNNSVSSSTENAKQMEFTNNTLGHE